MPSSARRCPQTQLAIPECSCARCLQATFDLYYARREARAINRREPSPEQLGRIAARAQIARSVRQPT